jgi:predicted HicB family RNase H-like nuclease
MDLRFHVESLHRQLAAAAAVSGEDARVLVERLAAPLDAAIQLTLQDVVAAAAEEITTELAPGSVEVRLRGRDPEFVVTLPPAPAPAGDEPTAPTVRPAPADGDEGGTSRINVRMPDQLKARVEQAANAEGLSVNTWIVRAAAAALDRTLPARPSDRRGPQGGQRYTGWAR